MLSKEDRSLIKILRIEKGYRARRLVAEFPREKKNWFLASVRRLLHKIDTTGSARRKPAVVDVALRVLTRTLIASKIIWSQSSAGKQIICACGMKDVDVTRPSATNKCRLFTFGTVRLNTNRSPRYAAAAAAAAIQSSSASKCQTPTNTTAQPHRKICRR